jgi:hypothetical protein
VHASLFNILILNVLQHYTFYDFIVSKARGKSGPLFNFDVHDDVRLLADATKEKDESHAGKVVERNYYQRNKHIFPASRWEVRQISNEMTKSLTCPTRCMSRTKTTGNTPFLEAIETTHVRICSILWAIKRFAAK